MTYLDYSLITKQILRYGEDVDIEVYGSKSYSDYGDTMAQTTTIYSVQAIFNTYGINQNYVPEGMLEQTRFSFFFKGDQTGLEIENVIVRANGERWKITKVFKHCAEGQTVVQEASVSNG